MRGPQSQGFNLFCIVTESNPATEQFLYWGSSVLLKKKWLE